MDIELKLNPRNLTTFRDLRDQRIRTEERTRWDRYQLRLNILNHFLIYTSVVLMVYLTFIYVKFSFITIHLVFGSFWFHLSAEAMMSHYCENFFTRHIGRRIIKTNIHVTLQLISGLFAFISSLSSIVFRDGKPGTKYLHACMGIINMAVLVETLICGAVNRDPAVLRKIFNRYEVRLGHHAHGMVSFSFGFITLILGYNSGLMYNCVDQTYIITLHVLAIVVFILTLLGPTMSFNRRTSYIR